MKLYIVRHGETSWNVKKLLQGKTDISLNENGINQVKTLEHKLPKNKIDICICSPLKRTIETANILYSNIIKDDLLIERDYGDFEGKSIDYNFISLLWDYKVNYHDHNVESIKECLERANKFLKKIKKYKGKNILIVSHGAFIKALHYNLVGYNENTDFLSFNPSNSELYEYEILDF